MAADTKVGPLSHGSGLWNYSKLLTYSFGLFHPVFTEHLLCSKPWLLLCQAVPIPVIQTCFMTQYPLDLGFLCFS